MSTEADIVEQIVALEERRYRAMLEGDVDTLAELCSADLTYSHSQGQRDDRASHLGKVRAGHFVYHEIAHPADRILVLGGAVLLTGRMTARVTVAGEERRIDNAYLAVFPLEAHTEHRAMRAELRAHALKPLVLLQPGTFPNASSPSQNDERSK